MNTRTILQVPIDKSIKKQATVIANEMGFSSLQETVRVFISKLISRELTISIMPSDTIQLSPKAIKRYNKILQDIKSEKNLFEAENVKDFMKQLSK